MSYQAGDTYPAQVTVRDDEGNVVDPPTLQLKVRNPAGTVTTYDYPDDAIIVNDSTGIYHADVSLDTAGMWVIAWQTTDEEQVEGVNVWASDVPTATITFCTPVDVATRLGRDLTAAEAPMVAMLCELATDTIAAVVDLDEAWVAELTAVPRILRILAIELVKRSMTNTANPTGALESTSETIGAYSYTERFRDTAGSASDGAGGAMTLSDAEVRMARKAVWGTNSASAGLASAVSCSTVPDPAVDIYDWLP
jgi:hypothetical protein